MKLFNYLPVLLWLNINDTLFASDSDIIKWKKYDAKFMKPTVRDYYKYSWDTKITVPRTHSDDTETGTFEIYVRKFSHVEMAKKHLWLVSGGPGSSTSGIERALSVMLPDTAIYIMDNRGLGESHA